jgi:CNT family concentrative nucleoside transporter
LSIDLARLTIKVERCKNCEHARQGFARRGVASGKHIKGGVMERVVNFVGLLVMMVLAWGLSVERKRQNARLILSGIAFQFILAVVILWTQPGQWIFSATQVVVTKVVGFSDAGVEFVFGAGFKEHFFAFSMLPTIIFVSSLMAVLFHLGILQKVVEFMAWVMVYVMDVSGSESLAAAVNVFVGMAESPLVIKP